METGRGERQKEETNYSHQGQPLGEQIFQRKCQGFFLNVESLCENNWHITEVIQANIKKNKSRHMPTGYKEVYSLLES